VKRDEPPPSNTDSSGWENAEEAARIKARLSDQLRNTMKEDIASRRKTFKLLCLEWHPDKNQDGDLELATQIFQFLQTQKDWYLKE